MPVWETVRNASCLAGSKVIAKAAILASMRVRKSPASHVSETTSTNARSVVRNNRCATGMRSAS